MNFTGGLLSGGVSYLVDSTIVDDPRKAAGKGSHGKDTGEDKKG